MAWQPARLTRVQMEERRLAAGQLLRAEGLSQAEIARRLGIDRFVVVTTFVIREGKIISFRTMLDTSDPQSARYAAGAATLPSAMPSTGGAPLGLGVIVGLACLAGAAAMGRLRFGLGKR
jgi:hypothetical protein